MEATIHSLEQSRNYLYSLSLDSLIDKIIVEKCWSKRDTVAISVYYRNFLWLQRKYGHQYSLSPSQEVDIFWHYHILDTQKYRLDCDQIFGKFFHHQPMNLTNVQSFRSFDFFEKTQELHLLEFGEEIYQVRSYISKMLTWVIKLVRLFFKVNPISIR